MEHSGAGDDAGSEDVTTADAPECPSLSPPLEDALRHLYRLETTGDGWVANTTLAAHLDVTKATVTSRFDALADHGFVEREKYRPVRLTDAGRTAALDVVRRHRLAETALFDLFDYRLAEVDAEADVLEHHLSERLCAALERALGMPTTDPHGDPIPDETLSLPESTSTDSLASAPSPGQRVEVTRVRSHDDALLDYLADAGLVPGATITLTKRTSFGMVTVEADGVTTSLPDDVATSVLVTPIERTETTTSA